MAMKPHHLCRQELVHASLNKQKAALKEAILGMKEFTEIIAGVAKINWNGERLYLAVHELGGGLRFATFEGLAGLSPQRRANV